MAPKIQLSSGEPLAAERAVVAVGVVQGALQKHKVLQGLDQALGGSLFAEAASSDFSGAADAQVEVQGTGRISARRVLLIGLGPKRSLDAARLRSFAAVAARAASQLSAPGLTLVLPEKTSGEALRAVAEGAVLGAYRFTKYLTGERLPKQELAEVDVLLAEKPTAADKKQVALGVKLAEAVCIARDAVNEPPNELTPARMATLAEEIAKANKLKIKVLDRAGIAEAGMKLHYAVGQGSVNEPRFIHLSYTPKRAKQRVVFVGKGLTFDSGGLCIKPAPGMGEMKSDMGGAASVLGVMAAVAALAPNIEVHGVIGAAENMPDGEAYRPGDIFGSLDGKTVEIINTDAEGRLVLADALAYAKNLGPDLIIDAATLTGACMVALGKNCTGFYTADDRVAKRLEAAAKHAGEQFWRMPLLEELREQLRSDCADLKHTGDRWGGSISAALFLREFVGEVPWVHCDIAGPALSDAARGVLPKGGTGHPVLTFLSLLEQLG
ncbi:MAG: leucyl aminopeptidase [Polyangiaceae bacterium]|nr:leucyl aminopeptidase [Polyangiaceae bacterium]MCW5789814.1 leucyl aminopeptidase [Polyangiaceae bacterium]